MSERHLKICRRLLLEMYNMWPESVPFRDVADLNFPAYLDKIKEPIALDVIKERLDEENPDQYAETRAFLADLRKMFRNCFTFNVKESEIYKHARKLEDKLDMLLKVKFPCYFLYYSFFADVGSGICGGSADGPPKCERDEEVHMFVYFYVE